MGVCVWVCVWVCVCVSIHSGIRIELFVSDSALTLPEHAAHHSAEHAAHHSALNLLLIGWAQSSSDTQDQSLQSRFHLCGLAAVFFS